MMGKCRFNKIIQLGPYCFKPIYTQVTQPENFKFDLVRVEYNFVESTSILSQVNSGRVYLGRVYWS